MKGKITVRHLFVTLLIVLLFAVPAQAAVAFGTVTESHTGTTGSISQTSFDISIPFTASTKGLLVFTFCTTSATEDATSVKIDPAGANTDVPAVSSGSTSNSSAEPGTAKTWFLGSGLPTTTTTVRVNRNNTTNEMFAVVYTVTAGADTEVAGVTTRTSGASTIDIGPEVNIDDGSTGVNSVRFAGAFSGLANFTTTNGAAPGAASTESASGQIDFGTRVSSAVRETTAGQGSRAVGFDNSNNTLDDLSAVYLAVRELFTPLATAPLQRRMDM